MPIKEDEKMAEKKLTYKTINIDFIIAWCKQNEKVDWLKAKMEEEVPCKVYPRKKVAKVDELGNPILNEKGKVVYVSVADKSKKPTVEMRKIGFVQIKNDFVDEFMPQVKPKKKAKKPTMYDRVRDL
jgi:hypothetical protein